MEKKNETYVSFFFLFVDQQQKQHMRNTACLPYFLSCGSKAQKITLLTG